MREVISPNVKAILDIRVPDLDPFNYHCTINNGVIVATPTIPLVSNIVQTAFDAYEDAGQLYNVGVTGLPIDNGVGSVRFCNWQRRLADNITTIVDKLGCVELVKGRDDTWHQFEECSKYFRWMKYANGGQHFPHYDSDWVFPYDKSLATLYTMIIYWTDCNTGELAFVNDPRGEGVTSDWERQATEEEIRLKVKPVTGRIVMFPHHMCHTVLPYTDNGQRIITRGDLIFRKVA